MAYREVAMWEILTVLERIGRGESQGAVARTTGHVRKTIRRSVRTARSLGWEPGTDPHTEALAAAVFLRHRPAGARRPGGVEEELLPPHLETIRGWLTPASGHKRGLRLTKVRKLLARQGVEVPYTSLHRFAVNYCDFGKGHRATVRMAGCEPGGPAEVDFGRLGLVPDPAKYAPTRTPQSCHPRSLPCGAGAGPRPWAGPASSRAIRPPLPRAEGGMARQLGGQPPTPAVPPPTTTSTPPTPSNSSPPFRRRASIFRCRWDRTGATQTSTGTG